MKRRERKSKERGGEGKYVKTQPNQHRFESRSDNGL